MRNYPPSIRDLLMIVEGKNPLIEAQDYESMFNPLLKQVQEWHDQNDQNIDEPYIRSSIKKLHIDIQKEIKQAKQSLKRNDRIVWYLKLIRQELAYNLAVNTTTFSIPFNGPSNSVNPRLYELEHYLSLPIPEIQNLQFKDQTPVEIISIFSEAERQWKASRGQLVPFNDDDKVVMQFPDGFAWVFLDREYCETEGGAMGHCGNRPSARSGDTILSLRRLVQTGNEKFWRPSLTFIIDGNGLIGEMKGRGNEKPAEKYHPHIIALLKSDLVNGIKGGGYLPENNFSVNDLSEEEQEDLFSVKPQYASVSYLYKKYGMNKSLAEKITHEMDANDITFSGFTEDLKYGIIKTYPNWEHLVADVGDIDFIRIVGNLDDMFSGVYDNEPDPETVWNDLDKKDQIAIGRYLQVNEPDSVAAWCEENNYDIEDYDPKDESDVFSVIQFMDGDFLSALNTASFDAMRSGAEADCFKHIKSALTGGVNGLNSEYWVYILWNNPENEYEFKYDAEVSLVVKTQDLIKLIETDYFEENEMYHAEDWLDGPIKLEEPYYGYSGYDEDVAIERFKDEAPDYSAFMPSEEKPKSED